MPSNTAAALPLESPAAPPAPEPAHLAQPRYRRDIDGLRAIAVLVVVAYHAFPEKLPGGFVGVDVFFVISGYLISSIILGSLAKGSFTFREFYARRVRRIFPALVVSMAACLAFGWFALFPDELAQLAKHIVGGAAFVSNLVFWSEVSYFDNAAETKPLLHLWSLGIEEQFYIVWPVLLAAAWRWRWGIARTMAAVGVVSFAINVGGVHRYASATFYSPVGRAWELAIGGLLACATLVANGTLGANPGPRTRAVVRWLAASPGDDRRDTVGRNLMAVAGLALLGIAVALLTRERSFPGWWALLPTVGTGLVIAAGPGTILNRWFLSLRPMVWIGLISYPLYLWHWPLLSFARVVESDTPALRIRVAAVVAAFVLAALTYLVVEWWFRHGSRGRLKVGVAAAAMILVAGLAAGAWAAGGVPQRTAIRANLAQQQALVLVEDKANAAACKARYGFTTDADYCLLAHVDRDPTVALVGDSHGYHVVAGLTRYYESRGENLLYLGTRIPFWDVAPIDNDKFQAATNHMLDIALETPSVHTVIVTTAVKLPNYAGLGPPMRETLRRFTAAGKKVIWIDDIPWLDFEPRACIRRGAIAATTTKDPCAMERAAYDVTVQRHDRMVKRILADYPTVDTFAPAPYLCDTKHCLAMRDGTLLYRDRHHLSYEGDLYIGEKFAAEQDAKRAGGASTAAASAAAAH